MAASASSAPGWDKHLYVLIGVGPEGLCLDSTGILHHSLLGSFWGRCGAIIFHTLGVQVYSVFEIDVAVSKDHALQ